MTTSATTSPAMFERTASAARVISGALEEGEINRQRAEQLLGFLALEDFLGQRGRPDYSTWYRRLDELRRLGIPAPPGGPADRRAGRDRRETVREEYVDRRGTLGS